MNRSSGTSASRQSSHERQVAIPVASAHLPTMVVPRMASHPINDTFQTENRVSGRLRARRESSTSSYSSYARDSSCCECCSRSCNSQICCSYVMALLASSLVVGGVYVAVIKWNYMWLIPSVFGLMLIFFGACLYYCGSQALARKWTSSMCFPDDLDSRVYDVEDDHPHIISGHRGRGGRRKRRQPAATGATVEGVPSSRSLSQLSLNMIPQYFAPSDTPGQGNAPASRTNTIMTSTSVGSGRAAAATAIPTGQIFSLNGQSFLILPLTNEPTTSDAGQCIPLESLVVKVPANDNTNDDVRKQTVTEFLANFDSKAYNNVIAKSPSVQTQTSSAAPKGSSEDTGIQTEEDSSIMSLPSSSSFALERRQPTQENPIHGMGNKPSSSTDSHSQPTSGDPRLPKLRSKRLAKPEPQPLISTAKTSTTHTVIENIPPVIPSPGHSSASTSFFISFPPPSSKNVASGSSSHNASQSQSQEAGPSVRRKDTFSKSRPDILPVRRTGRDSPTDSSSPDDPSHNLLDARRYGAEAEAAAERNHSRFVSRTQQELLEDEPDLEESEFLSPPPSYSEVMESDYDSPEDESNAFASPDRNRGTF